MSTLRWPCCGRWDDRLVARRARLGVSGAGGFAQLCGAHRYALSPPK